MANVKITDLTAATALGGTELFEMVQSAASVKATATQIKTFVGNSLNITGGVLGSVTISNSIGQFDSITITTGNVGSITASNGTYNSPTLNSATLSNAVGEFDSITVTAGVIPYDTITGKAYGFFTSTRDQSFSANVDSVLSVDTAAPFNTNVTVNSSTQITMLSAGVYEVGAAIQFTNSDSTDHGVTVWFRKDGVNIPASSTKIVVPKAADGGAALFYIDGIESFAISSYIECVMSLSSSLVIADYTAASVGPPAIPSTPSVNISVKKVGL